MNGLRDQKLQEYYDNMFTMFSTPAWAALLDQVDQMRKRYNDVRRLRNSDDLHFTRGQLDILDWLTSQKDAHEKTLEMLLEAEQ